MAIAEPDFIDRDPAQITSEMIALYEEASGKKLYPAQAERLPLTCLLIVKTLSASPSRRQRSKTWSRIPVRRCWII